MLLAFNFISTIVDKNIGTTLLSSFLWHSLYNFFLIAQVRTIAIVLAQDNIYVQQQCIAIVLNFILNYLETVRISMVMLSIQRNAKALNIK